MFSFFNKFKKTKELTKIKAINFEIELTASILAYEIARSDGQISDTELEVLLGEIKKVAIKVNKPEEDILKLVEDYSKNSVSFYDFIEDINKDYSKKDKLDLLKFLWNVAYADNLLEVSEERLIRRIANLIKIKDIEVLKLKDLSKK